jgi:lysozyme
MISGLNLFAVPFLFAILLGMKAGPEAFKIAKVSEGLRLQSYQCPAGKWTIGYGSTAGVVENMRIDERTADRLLVGDFAAVDKALATLVQKPLTQNQYDAIADFVYNVGPEAFRQSTILRYLNAGKFASIPAEFRRWVYSKGVKLPGLVKRREREVALWEGRPIA